MESDPSFGKPVIEVFSRHCLRSLISQHKERFLHYTPEKAHRNLLATCDLETVHFHYILDVQETPSPTHFLKEKAHLISAGSEAKAFLALLDLIVSKQYSPETLLYLVEEDYLHRSGWDQILREGLSIPGVDYVTLYDHKDKYEDPIYAPLESKLFVSSSCHWRKTPSTTQTFACTVKTLLRDLPIHRRYSTGRTISADHDKFCHLNRRGATLISSIPGWATHVEPRYASPCFDWSQLI